MPVIPTGILGNWPGPCPDCGAQPGQFHADHCPGPHKPMIFRLAGKPVCVACGDTGVASNGSPCGPCMMKGRIK